MLDTTTKKRIDNCRDILVGKLPDPKAQIEQITIGLIYKFMDDMDKEAIDLGGKAKFFSDYKTPNPEFPNDRKKDIIVPFSQYSWDNLFNAKVTAAEMLRLYSEAIAGMDKNPNIPQLFRDIFKNAFLPYRDPETLKLFLKTIGEFEYTHSEKLGDAFEYLLSVMGSQGDAGQFRTPRHIIDFVTAIVNPGKNDKILDPACGTAGFLISAFKHIKNGGIRRDAISGVSTHGGLTPDEQKRMIQNFVGYDISPDMVRLSLVNLYLHGFSDPHIWEYDTLSSEERWDETFDVILANPPFMSPKGGIRPHKKFSIASNRSEVLFVDYIAEHLNPRGRAGIIVPEGVIFQSGTAYKELRKMLVENYLYAVVSLPAGVFNPYSGVKTSVLLLDKQLAKTKDEILFVKIENDGFSLGAQRNEIKGGQLDQAIKIIHEFALPVETQNFASPQTPTAIAHPVPKKEIAKNGDYNLSGERYKTNEVNESSFPIVSLGDYIKVDNGRVLTEFDENGKIACIKVSDMNLPENANEIVTSSHWVKKSDYSLLPINSIVFPKRGAAIATNKKRLTQIPCLIDNNCMGITVINESELNPKYLFAFMRQFDLTSISNSAGIALINNPDIKGVQIPLPPLSIQQEIVTEIEGWQKIIDGAKAVVENYKPTIAINPDWEMVELGEVATLINGRAYKQEELLDEGPIPVLRVGNFFSNRSWYYSNMFDLPADKYCDKGDLLYAWSASFGPKIWEGPKVIYHYHIWKIEIKGRIEKKFLYFLLEKDSEEIKSQGSGIAMMHATKSGMEKRKFPLPPLETQRQIVSQIEKEQALVNANKQLIALFEQKIKDRIAKVWGADKKAPALYKENDTVSMAAEE